MELLKDAVKRHRRRRFSNARAVSQHGKRDDLGDIAFRSRKEANIARWLNWLGIEWEYEPKEFEFPVKRGIRFYTPDFFIPEDAIWYEVKGWMNPESITKLRRFRKYYYEEFEKLYMICAGTGKKGISKLMEIGVSVERIIDYKVIDKYGSLISPFWEFD